MNVMLWDKMSCRRYVWPEKVYYQTRSSTWCDIINMFTARPTFPLVPSLGFAEVPAGYLLWCRCTAELHVLNDEYTCQWHLLMHIYWRDNSAVAANVLRGHWVDRRLEDDIVNRKSEQQMDFINTDNDTQTNRDNNHDDVMQCKSENSKALQAAQATTRALYTVMRL